MPRLLDLLGYQPGEPILGVMPTATNRNARGGSDTGRRRRVEVPTAAMCETQRQTGHLFDKAAHPEMARCWCRKPSAGAVVEAVHGLARLHPGECYPPYMVVCSSVIGRRMSSARLALVSTSNGPPSGGPGRICDSVPGVARYRQRRPRSSGFETWP